MSEPATAGIWQLTNFCMFKIQQSFLVRPARGLSTILVAPTQPGSGSPLQSRRRVHDNQ